MLALGLMGCSETAGTGGSGGDGGASGSFRIVRDGEEQRYDGTNILLWDEGPQWALVAANYIDPLPDFVDDEYADKLRVVFGKEALEELVIDEDYPISGVASWPWAGYSAQASFVSTGLHTVVIEHIFFSRICFMCAANTRQASADHERRAAVGWTHRGADLGRCS